MASKTGKDIDMSPYPVCEVLRGWFFDGNKRAAADLRPEENAEARHPLR